MRSMAGGFLGRVVDIAEILHTVWTLLTASSSILLISNMQIPVHNIKASPTTIHIIIYIWAPPFQY